MQNTPTKIQLEQGTYDVTLKAEGYFDETIRIWINPSETTTRAVTLTAESEPPPTELVARVSVNSSPTGAKILVNGVWTDKYTPDSDLLKAGQYEIGLTKSGYEPWYAPLNLVEES